jgi:hypothetical protein
MLGKNLLWVAKQHGHSVEVMLRMYAAWLEGATDADIHAIKKATEKGTLYARRNFRFSRRNFHCKCCVKSRHANRDSSPEIPRIWQ